MVTVYIVNPTTGDQIELPYEGIQYIEELNNGGQATINFDFLAVKEIAEKYNTNVVDLFTATLREIWIEKDGIKVWVGVVSEYDRSRDANGLYTLTIAAIDYFALLQKRRTGVSKTFTNTDPAVIAWTLIDESQTSENPYSDFGITLGRNDLTGLSQSVTYQFAEINQEITKLSNANQSGSFDFDIDTTKKFNTYYPTKGTLRSNIVLDENNIDADSIKIPVILHITNEVYVVGQGINSDVVYVNRQSSNSYKTAFKKLEDMIRDMQQTDSGILDNEGDRYLQLNQSPTSGYIVSVTLVGDEPDITTYDVGDTLILNLPEENITNAQYRVRKRTVNIDKTSTISTQLDMMLT